MTTLRDSEVLRLAAESMERGGFDPEFYGPRAGCGCFAYHLNRVSVDRFVWNSICDRISAIVGDVTADKLRREGWTKEDAVVKSAPAAMGCASAISFAAARSMSRRAGVMDLNTGMDRSRKWIC